MNEARGPSKLEQLRRMSVVVADTGEIAAIRRYRPEDATTNPSLLLKAAEQEPEYAALIDEAVAWAQARGGDRESRLAWAADRLAVAAGIQILSLIPGRVSTEVDARLSFDTEGTIRRAQRLVELYEAQGASRDRVLIKIASTWEGIRAAERLEREGIHCNMTLLFSLVQAAACADAGAFLISPFVGRILDWYRAQTGREYPAEEDPGVLSVRRIYAYYKRHGYPTIVMAASFRNTGEVEALAGCDRLTIAPPLLEALDADHGPLPRRLSPDAPGEAEARFAVDEAAFRWTLNEDAMATEKLAEGIRRFAADQRRLEALLAARLDARG